MFTTFFAPIIYNSLNLLSISVKMFNIKTIASESGIKVILSNLQYYSEKYRFPFPIIVIY